MCKRHLHRGRFVANSPSLREVYAQVPLPRSRIWGQPAGRAAEVGRGGPRNRSFGFPSASAQAMGVSVLRVPFLGLV